MTSNTGQNGSCRRWRGYEARSRRGGTPRRPRGIRSPRDLRRRSPVRGRAPDPSTVGPCGGRGAGGAGSRRAAAGGRQEQDCVMATDERIGESISTWLEQTAPPRLPERVLEATFERTRRSRQQVGWRARLGGVHMPRFVPALGSAAVVVVAAAVALNFYVNRPSIGGPVFQGTWVSTTDADGGTQTMTVRGSADGAVEIGVRDDVASGLSGGPMAVVGTTGWC